MYLFSYATDSEGNKLRSQDGYLIFKNGSYVEDIFESAYWQSDPFIVNYIRDSIKAKLEKLSKYEKNYDILQQKLCDSLILRDDMYKIYNIHHHKVIHLDTLIKHIKHKLKLLNTDIINMRREYCHIL